MKVITGLYKKLYYPVCRAYARHIMGDGSADRVMCSLLSLHFRKVHGYWPDLFHPRSFSEKVCNRMLFDRDPCWTLLSDKYRVRDYVARRAGEEYLIPLLWSGTRPEEIPFEQLPSRYVIKASHGCRYNIIVKDKRILNTREAILQLKKWLRENYCREYLLGTEWAYKGIKPTVVVEAFLEENGSVPLDYKFFCFSGRAEYLQISYGRFDDASERILDREFNPLDVWNGLKLYEGDIRRPGNYEEMLHVAESLSSQHDFIRVDLYNVGGKIYFGELTCYPAAGFARFIPRTYDFLFGEKWKKAAISTR